MIKTGSLKAGIITSYLSLILNILTSFLLTPYILRSLGPSQYGLYTLISSIIAYLIILDFGFGDAIIRYTAKYKTQDNKLGLSRLLSTTFIIYVVIAILAFILGIIIFLNLENIFGNSFTPEELILANKMVMVCIFNVIISFPINGFSAIIKGHEKFDLINIINIFRIILRSVLIIILLSYGNSALALIIIDTLLNIFCGLIYIYYVFHVIKIRIKFKNFDIDLMKKLSSFTFFIFIGIVADNLLWSTGQIVLGIFEGPATVAIYVIGIQIVNYYRQFSGAIAKNFIPRATMIVVKGADRKELTDLMVRTGRIQFIILGYLFGGILLFGREFIILWAGAEYHQSWIVALIIIFSLTIHQIQNVGNSILQALNKHAFRYVQSFIAALINILITVLLTKHFGMIGTAISTGITLMVAFVIILNCYYHFHIGLDMIRFFKEVSSGLFPSFLLCILLCSFSNLLYGPSWIMFVLRCIYYSLIYFIILWKMGLNDYEKSLVINVTNRLFTLLKIKKYFL